jgi:hypothetical protein
MKPLGQVLFSLIPLLGSVSLATAAQVTFQVNMSAQIGLGNFNPATDTVNVAGDPINGWSTSASPLAGSASNTNIYEGTFDVTGTAGSTGQYKYVMNTASGAVWEGNVGTAGGTGNRTFSVQDTNQVLPVVYFNNVTNSTTVNNSITFQIDMSVQTALGNFDPSSGTVTIAGEFNGWSTTANALTMSSANTNIWTITLVLSGADGSAVSYKYVMNGTWEANNVGANGSQNRSVTLARNNQTLPAVYFNNLTSIPLPTPLTFQVNMTVQTALGNFDPTSGYVEARGTFNNWNAGFTLTNSPDNTNLFSGTIIDTTDAQGSAVQYQFVLNNGAGAVWETAVGNRSYTLTSTNEQVLPLVYFNNANTLGSIAILPVSGNQATLTWTAGPLISLQSAAHLTGPAWQNVPNTQGSNSATVPIGPGQRFFRLIGP